ncbi:MAG: hypothetical protein CSA97_02045 [Bacteroidetes bacterium]|nr:MAG: hypothetical protein CSA97_02045 [Bacteroidota bacterium]
MLLGDTIPEDTPVLYNAYVKRDATLIYEYPSTDSIEVEQRMANDIVEVIGERGHWLAIKASITRIYELAPPDEEGFHYEKRVQLERLYIPREDVQRPEDFLLTQQDLLRPVYAGYRAGERLEQEQRVMPDRFLRMELVPREEFEAAWERHTSRGQLSWHSGCLRDSAEVLVPLDTGTYLVLNSVYGEPAEKDETARARAIVDSLRRIPHASERVVSLGMLLGENWRDIWGEEDEDLSRVEEEGEGILGQDMYYVGEWPGTGMMALAREVEAWSYLLFIDRQQTHKSFAMVDLGGGLPQMSPDSGYMVGIGVSWRWSNGAVLTFVRLDKGSAQVALELRFPKIEYFLMDEDGPMVFMADGSIYAAVCSVGVPVMHEDFRQYLRIDLRKGVLEE